MNFLGSGESHEINPVDILEHPVVKLDVDRWTDLVDQGLQ